MNTKLNTVIIDDNFKSMLISAVRYSLGRKTYINSITITYVESLIPQLDDHTIACIERDVRQTENYGDENIDKPEWLRLLKLLQDEMNKRRVNPW